MREDPQRLTSGDRSLPAQMTMELMVVVPMALVIALIVVNCLNFMGACASFDRVARNAIRVYATAPGYGQSVESAVGLINEAVQSCASDNISCSVSASGMALGQMRYTATLEYAPTLFGLGMREEILGVAIPRARHEVSLVVDPYHPGMFF